MPVPDMGGVRQTIIFVVKKKKKIFPDAKWLHHVKYKNLISKKQEMEKYDQFYKLKQHANRNLVSKTILPGLD